MFGHRKHSGFSLTEVLLAVGTLAIGMVFIAGVFPVGIHFTTIATERTIAAAAADEAFAKIKLYAGGDPLDLMDDIQLGQLTLDNLKPDDTTDFDDIFPAALNIDPNEFAYPSSDNDISKKQYYWSALLRRVGDISERQVQVTVFVSRKASPNLQYFNSDASMLVGQPMPVKVSVSQAGVWQNELNIDPPTFINDGCTIVDDDTGQIYRVLERYGPPNEQIIQLDRSLTGTPPTEVWVVPSAIALGTTVDQKVCSGRYPCIAVYQKVIRF